MSSLLESRLIHVNSSNVIRSARAKYIPQDDGSLRLAMVQSFSFPVFREDGFEEISTHPRDAEQMFGSVEIAEEIKKEYVRRAARRAKVNAFDMILCNPDLDTFCTFTYAPDRNDRASYDDVFKKLSVWCSNRVQRSGLKYIAVPEYHKDGENIHFHMVANRSALNLKYVIRNGHFIKHSNGSEIFNITDWCHGFTTAVDINAAAEDRDAVAKYIFKYMGKQQDQKIGGRYFLHGGKLKRPVYKLSDDPSVFFHGETPKYNREVDILDGATYREWTFI